MSDPELYSGLIRLHILHHAAQESIFGLGIMDELERHEWARVNASLNRTRMLRMQIVGVAIQLQIDVPEPSEMLSKTIGEMSVAAVVIFCAAFADFARLC